MRGFKFTFLASWIIYILCLIPFNLTHLTPIEGLLILSTIVGLGAGVLCFRDRKKWKLMFYGAITILLFAYLIMWLKAFNDLSLTSGGGLLAALDVKIKLTATLMARNKVYAAFLEVYFEIMPIIQLLFLGFSYKK